MHLKYKTSKTVIIQCHRMSTQTFCLYIHNNKSILCLQTRVAAVTRPPPHIHTHTHTHMCFGGSDVNLLELTVLSSGVRLYVSRGVVLYNDPQWRTLSDEHSYKRGEGCSSLLKCILLFLPFTTSVGILGSFDLSIKRRGRLLKLKRDRARS